MGLCVFPENSTTNQITFLVTFAYPLTFYVFYQEIKGVQIELTSSKLRPTKPTMPSCDLETLFAVGDKMDGSCFLNPSTNVFR